ncbi:hypothetical protein [Streptomyces griseorubiginosus]|uniref:hypothetical protein n=1 Tax=Streptomyces griseorubiginosus TaxID=67304 RepID=UPI003F75B996
MYAAFGDTRALFDEVVTVHRARHGAYTDRALTEEPTARTAVEGVPARGATATSAAFESRIRAGVTAGGRGEPRAVGCPRRNCMSIWPRT